VQSEALQDVETAIVEHQFSLFPPHGNRILSNARRMPQCIYREKSSRRPRKGLITMTSRKTAASTSERASKSARFSAAVSQAWAEARYADRRLMEIRLNITRPGV
jgi:hypothetical protein